MQRTDVTYRQFLSVDAANSSDFDSGFAWMQRNRVTLTMILPAAANSCDFDTEFL